MKKFATLFLSLGFMFQCSAFAIGAIAVDDSVGETDPAYGFSTVYDTEAEAKRAAMKFCKENGDNCKVVGWFKTCGAYASSKNITDMAMAPRRPKPPQRHWRCAAGTAAISLSPSASNRLT